MAYFANGAEGDDHVAKYCARCVHGTPDLRCPVFLLHWQWNSDAAGDDADQTKRFALNTLWPQNECGVGNKACAMFVKRKETG